MYTIRPVYVLLVILLSKGINGAPQYGFDVLNIFDDESDDSQKNTNLTDKNGKIISDWFSMLFDYFMDDSEEDTNKYLICKNCTVIVGQGENHSSKPAPTTNGATSTVPSTSSSITTQSPSTIDGGSTTPDSLNKKKR